MRFYTSGDWWPQAPPEIHALPLNLLRTTAYPAHPEVAQLGVQQLMEGYDPVIVPQRMGFTKWKDPGYPLEFGANVEALLKAPQHQLAVEEAANKKVASLPTADFIQAAQRMGLTRIPAQSFDPHLRAGYVPLAEGVTPMDQLVDARTLNEMAQKLSDPDSVSSAEAKRAAWASIQNTQDTLAAITGGHSMQPWFLSGVRATQMSKPQLQLGKHAPMPKLRMRGVHPPKLNGIDTGAAGALAIATVGAVAGGYLGSKVTKKKVWLGSSIGGAAGFVAGAILAAAVR